MSLEVSVAYSGISERFITGRASPYWLVMNYCYSAWLGLPRGGMTLPVGGYLVALEEAFWFGYFLMSELMVHAELRLLVPVPARYLEFGLNV